MPKSRLSPEKIQFFKPDVQFWQKTFSQQENQAILEKKKKKPINRFNRFFSWAKGYRPLNEEEPINPINRFFSLGRKEQSYLSNKRVIGRLFAILYHNHDITVNNHPPDAHIPIAHYLARGYDIQFDLSDLTPQQIETFWKQLIGEDVLAHAAVSDRKKTTSGYRNFLVNGVKFLPGWGFVYRTFNVFGVPHPYPAITTSAAVEIPLRLAGALIVSPIVIGLLAIPTIIYGVPYSLYRLGKAVKDFFVGKEKIFDGKFKETDNAKSTTFTAKLNEKTKQLIFSFKSKIQNNQLSATLKTTSDSEYRTAYKANMGSDIAPKNTCVVKITPDSLSILKDNPQGISREQLALPPRVASIRDASQSQKDIETFTKTTNQLIEKHSHSTTTHRTHPVTFSKPVRINVENLGLKFDLRKVENYFKANGIEHFVLNKDPNGTQIFSLASTVRDANNEAITIYFHLGRPGKSPSYIEFSKLPLLPLNQDLSNLALERAAIMLQLASSNVKQEENEMLRGMANVLRGKELVDPSLNSRLTEPQCKEYAEYCGEYFSDIAAERLAKNVQETDDDFLDFSSISSEESSDSSSDDSFSDDSSVSSDEEDDTVIETKDISSDKIWNIDYPYQDRFSSRATPQERNRITTSIINIFEDNETFHPSLEDSLMDRGYFIYHDNSSEQQKDYQKGNPIVERARAFLQASELWLDASTDVYKKKTGHSQFVYTPEKAVKLREDLNKLFWEFEAQSIYFPADTKEQQKALDHFLGKLTYLLNSNTKFNNEKKLPEDKALAKLYKELALAEALMVWQQGREEVLVTRVETTKIKENETDPEKTYTSLQIDYPISEITYEQYDELRTIYNTIEASRPDWFRTKNLPDFAKEFLKKTLADPNNPKQIAPFEDTVVNGVTIPGVKTRYKSMPATLKKLLGVSNFSESHYLVFGPDKKLISRSVEDRSSSLAANEMHDLEMEKAVAVKNARQVYLGEENIRAMAMRDEYQAFWGFTDREKTVLGPDVAPLVVSASVLSPESKGIAKGGRIAGLEVNLDMLRIKEHALQNIVEAKADVDKGNYIIKDNSDNYLIQLCSSNYIINDFRNYPSWVINRFSVRTRENGYRYLEHLAALTNVFDNRKKINSGNPGKNDFSILMSNLVLVLKALKKDGTRYYFDKNTIEHWDNFLNVVQQKFPANSAENPNALNQFITQHLDAFKSQIPGDTDEEATQRARDFLCGLHALIEYVKISSVVKETDPRFFGEDKNANLYRSALERVFIRKMHGRAHVACKSGKDRTGIAVLFANAIEKFWAIHGYIPQYHNDKHWNILMDYAADEFIARHHQRISKLNSPGADGLKSLKGMIPPLLKSRIIEKIAKIHKPNATKAEIKAFGKEFFGANKLGSSLNKPHPEFYNPEELAQIKLEVGINEQTVKSHDAYLIDQIINPALADILTRVLADQITPTSKLLDIEKIDKLNEAIFRNVDFNSALKQVGLGKLSKEERAWLKQENVEIANHLLSSEGNDEAVLTRIWQFSKRQPAVFEKENATTDPINAGVEKDFSSLLAIGSLKELIELQGIEGVEATTKSISHPYVIPTKVEKRGAIPDISKDLLSDSNVTVGISLTR